MPPRAMSPVVMAAFNTVMSARAIRSVYQPVVALDDGEVVAYEALARGPSGTIWRSPDSLLRYAGQIGRVPELDWICRAAAVQGAREAGLPSDMPLFVNIEPASARTHCPPDLWEIIDEGAGALQIVAELTERSLMADPAALLLVVERLRRDHLRIALDDVGADPSSQALMPLLQPDLIKLDRTVVRHPQAPQTKVLLDAVRKQAQRTGAAILAEGIETVEDLAQARAMGATLGQGWLFGYPGPLPRHIPTARTRLPALIVCGAQAGTPFDIARERVAPVRVDESTVTSARQRVEQSAAGADRPSVLLATFERGQYFDAGTRVRYAAVAGRRALTAVFAPGILADPGPNLRGCALAPDDPLTRESNVLVIGAHASTAVFAVQVPDAGPRRYDMIETGDGDLIIGAARPLLKRLAGFDTGPLPAPVVATGPQ